MFTKISSKPREKTVSPDVLARTSKQSEVELKEEDLQRVSGGKVAALKLD